MSRRAGVVPLISDSTILPPSAVPIRTIDDKLTLAELCDELQVARSTFYDWRAKGHAPRCIKLPNGDLRIRRSDLERWLKEREEGELG